MTIADRIRNRRLELGLSVDDLAALLNKNRATVYRYESNYIKSYSPEVLNSLAQALNTTPAYFYGYDDNADESEKSPDHSIRNPEIRLLAKKLDMLPKEQREQALDVFNAMYHRFFDNLEDENK